uniref:Tankyrase 1-binding protein C-terminal domain-containing protein n=1 Tax=Paramormyrops kingsleyae TaxID=1676925 RepID=A0A3B3T7R7_9TELE
MYQAVQCRPRSNPPQSHPSQSGRALSHAAASLVRSLSCVRHGVAVEAMPIIFQLRPLLTGGSCCPQHVYCAYCLCVSVCLLRQRALAGNGPREDDGMQDKLLSKEDDHYGSLDTAQHPGEDRCAPGSSHHTPHWLWGGFAKAVLVRMKVCAVPMNPHCFASSPTPTTTPTDALLEPGTPSELPSPSAVSPSAVSSMSWEATDPLPFPETPTSLLDSSALRSRVQLGKRRSQRAPPSRAARQKAAQDAKDPQFQDSAGTRSEMTAQEEKVKMKTEPCSTPLQPQRVAVFPGLDPSALKAQLKKRAGDSENQAEQLPPQRSAKSPFLPQATRVLPPVTDKENREHSSPQWLQELKSKKRFSQHESDT